MTIRRGFTVPIVYNSKDLRSEIRELGNYNPEDVLARAPEKADQSGWVESEVVERGTSDHIVTIRAKDEERIASICRAAGVELEEE